MSYDVAVSTIGEYDFLIVWFYPNYLMTVSRSIRFILIPKMNNLFVREWVKGGATGSCKFLGRV